MTTKLLKNDYSAKAQVHVHPKILDYIYITTPRQNNTTMNVEQANLCH